MSYFLLYLMINKKIYSLISTKIPRLITMFVKKNKKLGCVIKFKSFKKNFLWTINHLIVNLQILSLLCFNQSPNKYFFHSLTQILSLHSIHLIMQIIYLNRGQILFTKNLQQIEQSLNNHL